MTAKKVALQPDGLTAEERLRLYTPEEVHAKGLLPYTPRTLRKRAYAREIPHTTVGRKVRFRLEHIIAMQQACDVDPAKRGRRAA